jgi:hypothetical protein
MSFKNRILLSAMLLTLTAPLEAKCPTNFVEVHGKIECAFKPDARVLLSLLYADQQKEGVGEENALDVRGDSFKGEVTFNTFSSNNFLKGDRCGRKPGKILFRLIAGDGTERDRKELKVADDFRYDEAKATFAVRSDVILHGGCEPKCPDSQSKPCANPK